MRHCAAYDVAARMSYKNISVQAASSETVYEKLPGHSGGMICIDVHGEHSMVFNTIGTFIYSL
jgi:beta-aspartyl-peptidase (threonine type)